MMKTSLKFLIIFVAVLFFPYCKTSIDYAENKNITEAKWEDQQIIRFDYTSSDTLNSKDVIIVLRHGGHYPYRNIFFFITTLAPNGKKITDTVEYLLADEKGKWYGKGVGDIRTLQLFYKHNVRFAQAGRYIFYIQHGMRNKILEGITDVGLLIKNSDTKAE